MPDSIEKKCNDFVMTLKPESTVNVYEGYEKGTNLREKLGQHKAREINLRMLYEAYGMKRLVLRELDRGTERRQCALKPDAEFMRSLMLEPATR